MFKGSSLSEEQRAAAVALFERGWGTRAVATKPGVGTKAVLRLYDRWRVRGDTALVTKPSRLYSFEFKLNAVQRYLSGENRVALAKELDQSSPHMITVWAGKYRAEGEEGLRPKPEGRPRKSPDAPAEQEPELQRRPGNAGEQLFHRVRFLNTDALTAALHGYIRWYNTERISTKLKGLSPVQYLAQMLAA